MPITLAMLLSFVLNPLVELLRRCWLGRIPSVLLAVIVALGIIAALGTAIGTQVAHLTTQLPRYQITLERKLRELRHTGVNRLSDKIQRLGNQLNAAAGPPAAPSATSGSQQKPLPVVVTPKAPSALESAEALIAPIISPAATGGIILVVTIFTLLQKEDLRDRAIRLSGTSDLRRTTVALDDAARRLTRYFLTQLAINASFGAIVGAGLYFIGVPNPILWGILGALLRFVPYIGAWIAALLPIVMAAAVAPTWSMMLWTAALYVLTEMMLGQIVEPLIYGHTTGLSPLAVVIAAIFWTWIWGPVGLIISTPLTLCLVVLGRHAEHLEFFDVLLGDRPALTPIESFYQRILADDPDEVEAQAERYLADRSLSSYYDEIALKGLQLAADDIAREGLSSAKLERLRNSVIELVQDLDKYDDVTPVSAHDSKGVAGDTIEEKAPPKEPPPTLELQGDGPKSQALAPAWRGAAPVLCIAGRSLLDEPAMSMLAQLLRKHGLGSRVVPYEAVSRSNIRTLDVEGVAMACISYLDVGGNPAHLHYLLRRLRQRLPQAALLVGLWPTQGSHDVSGLRDQLGADYYVSSLQEALGVCLREACGQSERAPVPSADSSHAVSGGIPDA